MQMSKRLQAVVNLVSNTESVADVGCDHGYVAIYLYENQICKKVIALDVNTAPLEKAAEHIKACGYEKYIETRLSDGLKNVKPTEVKSMVCAGMGGKLMIHILSEGKPAIEHMTQMILQPQSQIDMVRQYVRQIGWELIKEEMVLEDKKYYFLMKAIPLKHISTEHPHQSIFDKFGKYLLEHQNDILKQYLDESYDECINIASRLSTDNAEHMLRLEQIKKDIKDLNIARSYFNQ